MFALWLGSLAHSSVQFFNCCIQAWVQVCASLTGFYPGVSDWFIFMGLQIQNPRKKRSNTSFFSYYTNEKNSRSCLLGLLRSSSWHYLCAGLYLEQHNSGLCILYHCFDGRTLMAFISLVLVMYSTLTGKLEFARWPCRKGPEGQL